MTAHFRRQLDWTTDSVRGREVRNSTAASEGIQPEDGSEKQVGERGIGHGVPGGGLYLFLPLDQYSTLREQDRAAFNIIHSTPRRW